MRGLLPIGRTAVVAALGALLTPAAAGAHLRTGTVAVDYEASVSSPRSSAAGPFSVGVYASDLALHLSVGRGHSVVVIGYLGEPFLRVGPSAVRVNWASPTAAAAGLLKKGQYAAGGRPAAWHPLHGGHSVVWHDSRVSSLAPGARSGHWVVPILVDGRRAEITGGVQRLRNPTLWPWLIVLALFCGGGAVIARVRQPRPLATSCIALGAIAAGAAVVTALSFAFDAYASPGTWIGGADEAVFAAAGAAVLIWAPPRAHVAAGLGLGLLGLAIGLSKGQVFLHAEVLSALPGTAARVFVTLSIGAGAAAGLLGSVWLITGGADAPS